MTHRWIFTGLLATFVAADSSSASNALEKIQLPTMNLASVDREQISLQSVQGKSGTVIVFVSTECPISNGYIQTVNRLREEFEKQGVNLVAINPNDGQSLEAMKLHRESFKSTPMLLKDAGGVLAKQLGVTHCPEVCLFDKQGTLRYRGRIDDRYVKRGGAPRPVRRHDLKDAVAQLAAGKPIEHPTQEPVGCPILPPKSVQTATTATVTYSKHVAAVMQKHCQECHRNGGVAPFPLATYDQVLSWAPDLVTVTQDGSMPPWKPTEGFGEFHNRRTMPPEAIAILAQWVQQGCAPGDPKDSPPAKEFQEGWKHGEPDLVLQPSEEYHLAPDGDDVYRNYVLETNLDHDVYISGYEILPGNNRIVHHVLLFLDEFNVSPKLDARDPGPGYSSAVGLPGFLPTGALGGWAPGNGPQMLEDGVVRLLPKKAKIVMQLHYHKSGKPETDLTKFGLYFAKSKPTRATSAFAVLPKNPRWGGLRIPPGAANHEIRSAFIVPMDLQAFSITPHMHLLGKDVKVTATRPDGVVVPLIEIKKWDFNWQESYHFAKMVDLPKGTRIESIAHFDNSEANPANPSHPPKLVSWGEQTTEEMCITFIEVVPKELTPAGKKVEPIPMIRMVKGAIDAYGFSF